MPSVSVLCFSLCLFLPVVSTHSRDSSFSSWQTEYVCVDALLNAPMQLLYGLQEAHTLRTVKQISAFLLDYSGYMGMRLFSHPCQSQASKFSPPMWTRYGLPASPGRWFIRNIKGNHVLLFFGVSCADAWLCEIWQAQALAAIVTPCSLAFRHGSL